MVCVHCVCHIAIQVNSRRRKQKSNYDVNAYAPDDFGPNLYEKIGWLDFLYIRIMDGTLSDSVYLSKVIAKDGNKVALIIFGLQIGWILYLDKHRDYYWLATKWIDSELAANKKYVCNHCLLIC